MQKLNKHLVTLIIINHVSADFHGGLFENGEFGEKPCIGIEGKADTCMYHEDCCNGWLCYKTMCINGEQWDKLKLNQKQDEPKPCEVWNA